MNIHFCVHICTYIYAYMHMKLKPKEARASAGDQRLVDVPVKAVAALGSEDVPRYPKSLSSRLFSDHSEKVNTFWA